MQENIFHQFSFPGAYSRDIYPETDFYNQKNVPVNKFQGNSDVFKR